MPKQILILDALVGDTGVHELDNVISIVGDRTSQLEFTSIHLHNSELTNEQIFRADGIIISGSPSAVYEDKPWMKKLEQAFRSILAYQKPTLAVCFGAQFLAQMLGAKVSKNPRGLEFGSVPISLTSEGHNSKVFTDLCQNQYVHATHNDWIESLPSGATLLAYNDNSPIQAYCYQSVLGTQFHPDVPIETMRNLLASRKTRYLDSGFLRGDSHYEQLHEDLTLGANGHSVLLRFLDDRFTPKS